MKIKKVSTEYFAGISNKEISFNDGINVIYGDNESGKSTIVNLISATLFQNTKIDKRKDKDFNENAFPASRTDGKSTNKNIDGEIEFETVNGKYKLTKEWGEEPVSKLTAPNGIFKNQDDIKKMLKDVLGCDDGIYKEMLLSPQSAALNNLERILNGSGETNKTLSDTVSQAFAESDGVPVDKLENEIEKAIFELTGNCWSIEKNAPAKKAYTEKSRNLGEIMRSLIELEKAQEYVNSLKKLEQNYDTALSEFSDKVKSLNKAENELSDFEKFADIIRDNKINEDAKERCEEELGKYKRALEEFPKAEAELRKAQKLAEEQKNRALLEQYENAKKFHDELQKITSEIDVLTRPDDDEIEELVQSEHKLLKLQNELRKMNISATLKMLDGNSVKITSLLSGEPIALNGENATLTEAVRIEIPGIMEMSLVPAEANISETNTKIADTKKHIAEIFDKYHCNSIEDIKKRAEKYDKLANDKKNNENQFNIYLGDHDFSELENKVNALADVRDMTSIKNDILALCGNSDINTFIGEKSNAVETFKTDYSSENELKDRIIERESELEKAQNALKTAENIPEKYLGISEADAYKEKLNSAVKSARGDKDDALERKTKAETELNTFIENHGDDLLEQLEKVESEYNANVDLLDRWLHIKEVFTTHKEALANNPLEDLEKNFVAYLGEISEDRITVEFTKTGKPDFEVASGAYKLDFAKLSDGTMEAVYLAFRLAVLEHLFPDGGGVIVLDDPLNDMDIERVERACKLIQKISERHQVIFLTCRKEYADRLGGNVIGI